MKKYLKLLVVSIFTIVSIVSCNYTENLTARSEFEEEVDIPTGGSLPIGKPDGSGINVYTIETPSLTLDGVTSTSWEIKDDAEGYQKLRSIYIQILKEYSLKSKDTGGGIERYILAFSPNYGGYTEMGKIKARLKGSDGDFSKRENLDIYGYDHKLSYPYYTRIKAFKGVAIVQIPEKTGSFSGKFTVGGVYTVNFNRGGLDRTQADGNDEVIVLRADIKLLKDGNTYYAAQFLYKPYKNIDVDESKANSYKDYTKSVIKDNWYFIK